jgi:hypothetical protein
MVLDEAARRLFGAQAAAILVFRTDARRLRAD